MIIVAFVEIVLPEKNEKMSVPAMALALADTCTVTVAGAVQLSVAVVVKVAQPGRFWQA